MKENKGKYIVVHLSPERKKLQIFQKINKLKCVQINLHNSEAASYTLTSLFQKELVDIVFFFKSPGQTLTTLKLQRTVR